MYRVNDQVTSTPRISAISHLTWLLPNLKVTISIQSCPSNVLDPMLDLSGPGIDTMAGTFSPIANHANLGKSIKVKIFF